MQWIMVGQLTAAVAEAMKKRGDQVHGIDELKLAGEASRRDLIWTINKRQWDLFTNDAELIRWVYEDRFPFKRSIVFLQLEGGEVEQDDAVERLFARYKRLAPGRLYTLTGSRVKIRQLPTGGPKRRREDE